MIIRHINRKFTAIASDITNHCNARCIFCFNKFDEEGCDMSEKNFKKILQVLPFVNEKKSAFLFSCRFEPSLHPNFLSFLDIIPMQFRKKVFFTTNLVKYFDDKIFHMLANSNIDYINVSLETFNPELYEKLTSVKSTHFYGNLDRMIKIFINTHQRQKYGLLQCY